MGWSSRYASFVTTAGTLGKPQEWTRGLLRCGLAAGPVFVAVFLFEGAVREGYWPLRHPVSSLALGPRGWIQAGNFAVAGSLFLAGAAGLARADDPASSSRAAPALIGAAGAGLIGSAVFTTDPVSTRLPAGNTRCAHPAQPYRRRAQSGGGPRVRRPARGRSGLRLAVLAGRPARVRALQRGHRRHHAGHHGAGRGRLRPVTPAGPARRAVPARQHHHRLRLAHSPVRTSTPPCTPLGHQWPSR